MVDQNGDRGAERPGKESLPKVKGPLDAVAANVTQKAERGIIQGSGLCVLVLRLEKGNLMKTQYLRAPFLPNKKSDHPVQGLESSSSMHVRYA